jgi:hypothetical protein
MENQESSTTENKLLSKIMAAYANIWADVILGKNLAIHLKSIEEDLVMLNEFVDGKEKLRENPLHFYRITNMLYRMKDVLLQKIMSVNN